MKTLFSSSILALVTVAILSASGCASPKRGTTVETARTLFDHDNASASESPISSTIEITGPEGTQFYGYYLMNGERVEVSDTVPQTITGIGITHLELRKTRKSDTLAVEVRAGSTYMTASAKQRTSGIIVSLDGGGSVKTF